MAATPSKTKNLHLKYNTHVSYPPTDFCIAKRKTSSTAYIFVIRAFWIEQGEQINLIVYFFVFTVCSLTRPACGQWTMVGTNLQLLGGLRRRGRRLVEHSHQESGVQHKGRCDRNDRVHEETQLGTAEAILLQPVQNFRLLGEWTWNFNYFPSFIAIRDF